MSILTNVRYVNEHNYLTPFNIIEFSETNSFKDKSKSFIFNSGKKVVDFLKQPETKIASLVSYWAVEVTITSFAMYAFIKLGMIGTAFMSLLLLAYITYATFGVIGEIL
jgi:hypothetical protein